MKSINRLARLFRLHKISFPITFIIFCLNLPLVFPQNQKAITNLYSHYLKGLLYFENADYAAAIKEFEEVKAEDPRSVHIRLKIASALVRLDELNEAENVLKEAKRIDPNNLDIYLALIFVYSYTKNDKELEQEYGEFLKKAHEKKPKDIGISAYLAQFYFYKKQPQEAINIYEKILETNPDSVDVLFWLGYLYDEAGKRNEAIRVWKRGLEADPAYAPILNSLGYIYAEEGIDLDAAEEMIKKALEKEPENGAYLDSLGWVYFKKADYQQAEKYLVEAVSYMKDPDIYMHLGELYITLDNIDKGISYYQEGLSHFPDNKELKSKISEYEKKDKSSKR